MALKGMTGGHRRVASGLLAYGLGAWLALLLHGALALPTTAATEPAPSPQAPTSLQGLPSPQGPRVSQASPAAPEAPSPAPSLRVALEHLVIRPLPDRPQSGIEVLDLLRVELPQVAPGSPGPLFSVPLPAGHQGLEVLSGLRPDSVAVGAQQVRGLLELSGSRLLTVAVRYRLPASRIPHGWAVVRPYPVEATVVLVHPEAAVAVAGAQAAGELEVDGTAYRAYVHRAGDGAGAVVLAPLLRTRPDPDPMGALPAVALAGAVAVAWQLMRWRRRRRAAGQAPDPGRVGQERAARWARGAGLQPGPLQAGPGREPAADREVDRLVDRILELDAQFAAGYLEQTPYRKRREALLSRLAQQLAPTPSDGGGQG